MSTFRGILLTKTDEVFSAGMSEIEHASLPAEGNVEVAIEYSTINYKDALALTNTAPVVRRWPMVPGIDGAGTVTKSSDPTWKTGDRFVLNGFGVGETHWGCLAETAKLKGDWLVPLPDSMTAKQAMSIGTAGYTAMLCLMALERHGVTPRDGEILVTGASGGVGSIVVSLLANRGFEVVASTGKLSEAPYLKALGAKEIIDRATLSVPGKPLQKERWAGVVDSVGSFTLVNACAQTRYGGTVAACGLAQGMDFPASVAPFILRGITLAGVDSVMAPLALRRTAWQRLATEMDVAKLEVICREISLDETFAAAAEIMAGNLRGRVVVKI
jgi:acrylyl-CoA reductase (NADPH)